MVAEALCRFAFAGVLLELRIICALELEVLGLRPGVEERRCRGNQLRLRAIAAVDDLGRHVHTKAIVFIVIEGR